LALLATVSRLVEQYATMLSKRGLPITPGSLHLTYFAGPAAVMGWRSVGLAMTSTSIPSLNVTPRRALATGCAFLILFQRANR
jgi:hypothetical protein